MKYKITEVSTAQMRVEYDDGSWCIIACNPNRKKEDYLHEIAARAPEGLNPVSLNDNPMKLGDEGVVGEGIEVPTPDEEPKFSWKQVRRECYPEYQEQMEGITDSLCLGDNKKLDLVKGHIQMVKELIPKEENQDQHWTYDQLQAMKEKVEKDPRCFGNGDYE